MCIAIPMQVVDVHGFAATCQSMGQIRLINTILLGEVPAGAWLLVAGDTAHRMIEEQEAEEILSLLAIVYDNPD